MADEVIHIADGESHCRIVDPAAGTLQAPLKQISGSGLVLDTRMQFEANAALDMTVVLKGLQPRQFFATVAFSDQGGLHLEWMPIDTSEQARLRTLLEAYRTLHKKAMAASAAAAAAAPEAPAGEKAGTRRVIKPKAIAAESSTAIVPFAEAPAEAVTVESTKGTSERVRTRRVLRPSSQKLPVPEAREPADAGSTPSGSQPLARVAPATDQTPHTVSIFGEESAAQVQLPDDGGDTLDDTLPNDSKTAVIGNDGRMDIGASIRNRAKSIRASELAARHDRVRVLNMGTIKQLITEAVEEASAHLTRSLGEQDRKRLLEEAEENFKERLKMFEAEKLSAEMKAKRLQEQLQTMQTALEGERKRTIAADQFTVSAEGLDEIEAKFKRLLDHSIAEGRVVPSLEEELRKVIATVFDAERQRIREQELQAQNEKIALLENKIKRLAGSLEDTERQRDEMQEWAQMLEASGGGALRNVFTPGLKDGDPNKKRKLALMKEILDINREMRKHLGIETKPVDEETLAKIKEAEASAKLTPEEQAELLAQRKRPAAPPSGRNDAEMANVVSENGNGAAPADGADDAADPEDAAGWEKGKKVVKVTAGAVRVTASGTEELSEGAEINPDDMPWEGPTAASDDADDGSVKKIRVEADVKAPPLERKKK